MSDELPDPLDFTLESLAARGALVERAPGRGVALLAANLAQSLGVAEELELSKGMSRPLLKFGGGSQC